MRRPFVSVHVPIHNEPPEVVLRTLAALQRQTYADLEVIVVDNNTADPELWEPVQRYCESTPRLFRFVHRMGVTGFKAGALNIALAETSAEAAFVAVVDADYETTPDFVARLVACADEGTTFVQGPQDYSTGHLVPWQAWAVAEYRRFFVVGMRIRTRHNALHLHGTMVLVRLDALRSTDGWETGCVTEDCELGLRLLSAGGAGVYVERSLGRGLVPLRFVDYLAQRRRWVTGSVQALRLHRTALLGGRSRYGRLSVMQRLCYFQGWLPWFRDVLVVLATAAVIGGAVLAGLFPPLRPHVDGLAALLAAAFVLVLVKEAVVLGRHVQVGLRETIGALAVIVAMSPTIAWAWCSAWRAGSVAFERTPKSLSATRRGAARSMHAAVPPVLLATALVVLAAGRPVSTVVLVVVAGAFTVSVLRAVLLAQPAHVPDRRSEPLTARSGQRTTTLS